MRCDAAIAVWLGAAASAALGQEVLLDQIDFVDQDNAIGNALGGDNVYGDGHCIALQVCDDFRTTPTGYIITQVQVANGFIIDYEDVSDLRVCIYPDLGGVPGEDAVYSARVSRAMPGPAAARAVVTNEHFHDDLFNLYGVLTTVSGLWIPLEPDTGYFISIQVDAGPDNWAYTFLDEDGIFGADSYFRDGPPEEGCDGGYGNTTWRAMGDRYEPANVNYRVVAISRPPPRPEFDGDGAVTAGDVAAFLAAWSVGEGDVDGDGDSDAGDVVRFLGEWAGERAKAPNGQRAKSEAGPGA